jgi:hypothetical protein
MVIQRLEDIQEQINILLDALMAVVASAVALLVIEDSIAVVDVPMISGSPAVSDAPDVDVAVKNTVRRTCVHLNPLNVVIEDSMPPSFPGCPSILFNQQCSSVPHYDCISHEEE